MQSELQSATSPGDQALRARGEGALERLEAGVSLLDSLARFFGAGLVDPRGDEALPTVLERLLKAEATVRRLLEREPAPAAEATVAALDRAREAAMTAAAVRLRELGVDVPEAFVERLVAASASRDVLYDELWYGASTMLLQAGPWLALLAGVPAWALWSFSPLAAGGVVGASALLRGGWLAYRRLGPRILVTGLGLHAGKRFWSFEVLWQAWSVSFGVVVLTKSHHQLRLMTDQSAALQGALQRRGVMLTTRDLHRQAGKHPPRSS